MRRDSVILIKLLAVYDIKNINNSPIVRVRHVDVKGWREWISCWQRYNLTFALISMVNTY